MKTKIRILTEGDRKDVCRLHQQTFSMIGQTARGFLPTLSTHPTWVATLDNQIIGYIQVRMQDKAMFCTWFGVKKRVQGHGVGKALLKRIVTYAKEQKASTIQLETRNRFRSAICLYLNQNFSIVGTRIGPDQDTMIKLELRLKPSKRL